LPLTQVIVEMKEVFHSGKSTDSR